MFLVRRWCSNPLLGHSNDLELRLSVSAITVLVYDTVLLFGDEVRLIWRFVELVSRDDKAAAYSYLQSHVVTAKGVIHFSKILSVFASIVSSSIFNVVLYPLILVYRVLFHGGLVISVAIVGNE